MKCCIKWTLALMLCLFLTVSAVLSVSALTPSYNVVEPYLSSPYYDELIACTLTGDMRRDVLAVAFTQLGYHEGDSEADMDGLNVYGNKNFVEYNRLYGKLDNGEGNGVSYGYAWCAAYVSWCLRQAGVPASLAKTEVSCSRMTTWFKENATFYARETEYIPLPGDIIMFHRGNGKAHHTGLVVGMKNGYVYTIEGNSGGVVGTHMYVLKDSGILGYCVPAYTVLEGTVYDFPMDAEASKPGEYVVTAESLNIRVGAGTSYEKIGSLSRGEKVAVDWCDGTWGRIDYNGQQAWVSMSHLVSAKYLAYTVVFEAGEGKGAPEVQRKNPGEPLTVSDVIPTQRGYTFVGWATEKASKQVAYQPGDSYTADENLTLYAVWTPEVYKLTLKLEDGSVWKTVDIAFGERVNAMEFIPEKESDSENHYTFAGWNDTIPAYLRGDTERTATFTATPLTAEEKAALTSAIETSVAKPEGGSNVGGAGTGEVVIAPLVTGVIAAVILAIGVILTVAIVKVRRRKVAEIVAEVDKAEDVAENATSEAGKTAMKDALAEEPADRI